MSEIWTNFVADNPWLEKFLAENPWLDGNIAALIGAAIVALILYGIIARLTRRAPKVAEVEDGLKILLADLEGEMRETGTVSLLQHFKHSLDDSRATLPLSFLRHSEPVDLKLDTGRADPRSSEAAELAKLRRSQEADLVIWGSRLAR